MTMTMILAPSSSSESPNNSVLVHAMPTDAADRYENMGMVTLSKRAVTIYYPVSWGCDDERPFPFCIFEIKWLGSDQERGITALDYP